LAVPGAAISLLLFGMTWAMAAEACSAIRDEIAIAFHHKAALRDIGKMTVTWASRSRNASAACTIFASSAATTRWKPLTHRRRP
jgi:hypothetical protein